MMFGFGRPGFQIVPGTLGGGSFGGLAAQPQPGQGVAAGRANILDLQRTLMALRRGGLRSGAGLSPGPGFDQAMAVL